MKVVNNMEICPRCGNILKDGFCDACGYPTNWIIMRLRVGTFFKIINRSDDMEELCSGRRG